MSEIAKFHAVSETRLKRWITAHLDYEHEDFCLIWPFGRKGGGYASFSTESILVHRLMCEYENGPAPSDEHYAAHSCERGKDGCVNPNHLRWRTPSENQLERFEHYGVQPRFKLNLETAAKIRGLQGTYTADTLAAMFNVSESNVRLIWAGKIWKAKPPHRIFTEQEVQLIRSTPWQVKSAKEFAAEFGVSRLAIDRVRQGLQYRWVGNAEPGAAISPALCTPTENKGE